MLLFGGGDKDKGGGEEDEEDIDDGGAEFQGKENVTAVHGNVTDGGDGPVVEYNPTRPASGSSCVCDETGCFSCPDGNCFACGNGVTNPVVQGDAENSEETDGINLVAS